MKKNTICTQIVGILKLKENKNLLQRLRVQKLRSNVSFAR